MLITHGTLVTLDPLRGVVRDGALRLEGARITDLGPSTELRTRYPSEEQVDAQGMLVMPGFVCAHTHLYRNLLRGELASDPQPHKRWPQIEAALSYEDTRYATLLGAMEAIRRGTTVLFDQHLSPNATRFSLDAVAEAILQSGLRACLSYTVLDRDGTGRARQGIQENTRFAQRAQGEPSLAASMGVGTCTWVSNESLRACLGSAALADIGFHISLGTYRGELRDCEARYSIGAVARLQAMGLLGPRTLVAHNLRPGEEELATLAKNRSTLVLCPRFLLHAGQEGQRDRWLSAAGDGPDLALGSDELPPDMLAELGAAPVLLGPELSTGQLPEQNLLAPRLVSSATGLACRVFRDRLGVLKEGYLADLVLLDYVNAEQVSHETWPAHLLTGVDAASVDTTIVGGRLLMRHRELLTLDERAIIGRACDQVRDLLHRL